MIGALKRYLYTEAAVALVASTIVIIESFNSTYLPDLETCFASGNCANLLVQRLISGTIVLDLGLYICYAVLVAISIQRFRDDIARSRMEPIGFFRSEVSPLSTQPGETREIECSLAEIRLRDGKLEYRGVNKKVSSNTLDFDWQARDVLVNRTDHSYRFFYRTEPAHINHIDGSPGQADLANLGFVDYNIVRGQISNAIGTFFDFTISGNYVQRKKLELSDARHILTPDDKRAFDVYFQNRLVHEHKQAMLDLLTRVENAYMGAATAATTQVRSSAVSSRMTPLIQSQLVRCALCIALNVGLGKISNLFSLPFSMDTVGTVLGAAILLEVGWQSP